MGYPVCPKCGHAPLPADQSLPAACPACGIVLAKFANMLAREEREEARAEEVKRTSLAGWLFHVPDAVAKANWYGRIAALVLFGLYTIKIFRDTDIKYGDLGGLFGPEFGVVVGRACQALLVEQQAAEAVTGAQFVLAIHIDGIKRADLGANPAVHAHRNIDIKPPWGA